MTFSSVIRTATHQLTSRIFAGLKIAHQSYLQSAYIMVTNCAPVVSTVRVYNGDQFILTSQKPRSHSHISSA